MRMFSASLLDSHISWPMPPPHSILHIPVQIKLNFQLVFVCSHPLGSPQRVARQDSTLARHWRLLTLAPPLSSLHQAKFSAYLPCLEFRSCLDLCLFVYPVWPTPHKAMFCSLPGEGLSVLVLLYHSQQPHRNSCRVEWTFHQILSPLPRLMTNLGPVPTLWLRPLWLGHLLGSSWIKRYLELPFGFPNFEWPT